jgi:hypothetical protein
MNRRGTGGAANDRRGQAGGKVLTIDVAHPSMSSDEAERVLDEALRSTRLSGSVHVIRIIHGYGSGGKGGTLKTTVRNWAYRRRDKIDMVIPGEEYSPLDSPVGRVLQEAGISLPEMGPSDPGVTILILP